MAMRSSSRVAPPLPVEDVLLEQREEALHGGVVAGRADLAHRSDHAMVGEGPVDLPSAKLASLCPNGICTRPRPHVGPLLEEFAYKELFVTNEARSAALEPWVHSYNAHRPHTAIGGLSPLQRIVNKADGNHRADSRDHCNSSVSR